MMPEPSLALAAGLKQLEILDSAHLFGQQIQFGGAYLHFEILLDAEV